MHPAPPHRLRNYPGKSGFGIRELSQSADSPYRTARFESLLTVARVPLIHCIPLRVQ